MTTNNIDIVTYLSKIYNNADGFFNIWRKNKQSAFFKTNEIEKAAHYIKSIGSHDDIYACIGVFDEKPTSGRGSVKDVVSVSVITCDLDIRGPNHKSENLPETEEQALGLLEGLPLPSTVLHTGGGLLAVWFLKEAYRKDTQIKQTIEAVQAWSRKNAEKYGWTVDKTADLARPIRIPHTFNCKQEKVREVRVLQSSGIEYSLEDFAYCSPSVNKTSNKNKEKSFYKKQYGYNYVNDGPSITVEQAEELLEAIAHTTTYHEWFAVIDILNKEFGPEITEQLVESWHPGRPNEVIGEKIASINTDYNYTVGTLVYLARRNGWRGKLNQPIIERPVFPNTETINQRYIDIAFPGENTFLIRSPINTGKTTFLSNNIPADASVLVLTHRITLGEKNRIDFNTDYYQDGNGALSSNRLVVTVDSLHKVKQTQFDYLIIDEAEQVFRHLVTSATLPNRSVTEKYLRRFVSSAGQVIAADADLGEISYNYLAKIRGAGNIKVVENTVSLEQSPVYQYPTIHHIQKEMLEQLRSGKKLYIATNAKSEAERIKDLITKQHPELRVNYVTSDTSKDNTALFKSINEEVSKYDVLITSPSIGSGVSIDVVHFDSVFLLGVETHTTYTDLLQQMGRVRSPKEIHCFVKAKGKAGPLDKDTLKKWAIENAIETGLHIGLQNNQFICQDEHLLDLWADAKFFENYSSTNYAYLFYEELRSRGYVVVSVTDRIDDNEVENIKRLRKEAKQRTKRAKVDDVANAKPLTPEEYASLVGRDDLTLEEENSVKQYNVLDEFELGSIAEIKPEHVLKYDQLRSVYFNFWYLHEPDMAKKRDMGEYQKNKSVFDLGHYTRKTELRREILTRAGVDFDNPNKILTPDNAFVDWVRNNKEAIERTLEIKVPINLEQTPLRVVSSVLKQVGLALQPEKKREGKIVKTYKYLDTKALAQAMKWVSKKQRERPQIVTLSKEPKSAGVVEVSPF